MAPSELTSSNDWAFLQLYILNFATGIIQRRFYVLLLTTYGISIHWRRSNCQNLGC